MNFDLFVEKAAPDVRLNSIDDPIIETRPLAAESEAVILEGVPEAEPIAGRIFSIPPFGKPRSARRLRNDACRCSDTNGANRNGQCESQHSDSARYPPPFACIWGKKGG